MIKDLTKGKPMKVLLLFALPMLLSMLFQQLYNIADSIVAGKFGGINALGSLSAATPVTNLFIAIAVGGTLGSSVVISHLFGAKDYKKLKTTIWTAIISLTTLAFFCTLIGIFITGPILKALDTPYDLYSNAKAYLEIYIFGFFFLFLYNIANSIFTGLGDSKTPLYLLIGSSLSNILLDILFAKIFSNVVLGVAWATFLAQSVASLIAIALLIHRLKSIKVEEPYLKFDFVQLKAMMKIAIQSILQQSFVSVGQLLVQSLINQYGTEIMDGYATALRINAVAIMSIFTLSNSMSSYTAQNLGNQDIQRVKEGYKVMILFSFGLVAVIICFVLIFSRNLISFFIKENESENVENVIQAGQTFLNIVVPFYFAGAMKVISDGVLRGSKQMKAFMFTTFLDLAIRVAFAYLFDPIMGYKAICYGFSVGWVISMIASFVWCILWLKKETRKANQLMIKSTI